MRKGLPLTLCLAIASPSGVAAAVSCSPKFPGARVLSAPVIGALARDWAPPNKIGTSWSLVDAKREERGGTEFVSASLVSPRGGQIPGRVFVVASEWDCE